MKRTPLVYTPTEIKTWHVEEEYLPGKWRPARPCGFRGVKYFAMRVRIAWSVFIGKYDALNCKVREKNLRIKQSIVIVLSLGLAHLSTNSIVELYVFRRSGELTYGHSQFRRAKCYLLINETGAA